MNLFKHKQQKTEKNEQMAMPMKRSGSEVVYGIKRNVDKSITYAGVIPYWRSFFFVAAFMASLITAGLIGYVVYRYYNILPPSIPLYFNQASQSWTTFGKKALIAIPVAVFLFAIVSTILNAKIYHFDRRLVMMLNISIILANIFLLVSMAQIFSLLLIY